MSCLFIYLMYTCISMWREDGRYQNGEEFSAQAPGAIQVVFSSCHIHQCSSVGNGTQHSVNDLALSSGRDLAAESKAM